MYVDKFYPDEAVRQMLANGVASSATADWPWLPVSTTGGELVRRRGLRTVWGKVLLYTYDESDTLEVGIEGYIAENPFFDLGSIWGNGGAVGSYLGDLVSMHFARLARPVLTRAGWQLEDHDKDDGRIFRVWSDMRALDVKRAERLGKSLGAALMRADVEHLTVACQQIAYLRGLQGFPGLPTRPIASPMRSD